MATVLLETGDDGTVRACSKYFIVRDDGMAGSGDYLDTFVRLDRVARAVAARQLSVSHSD